MKRVIITADDYGMCNEVDKAIDECIKVGVVQSTNVILNMDSFVNAKTLRIKFPNVSVGIHWNVTTGKPLLETKKIKSLVDKNGNFFGIIEFKKRMRLGKIQKKDLISELDAQYNLFYKYCGKPDYWNTHENSAIGVRSFRIFGDYAKKNGINSTRNFQRVYIDIHKVSFRRRIKEFLYKNIANIWFGILIKRKFSMPDGRLFPFYLKSKYNYELLFMSLHNTRKDLIEIVIHPSTINHHMYFGNLSDDRVDEFRFFANKLLKNEFIKEDIQLCNFNELNKRGHKR